MLTSVFQMKMFQGLIVKIRLPIRCLKSWDIFLQFQTEGSLRNKKHQVCIKSSFFVSIKSKLFHSREVKFGPRSCKFVIQIFNEVNFFDFLMPLYVAKSHIQILSLKHFTLKYTHTSPWSLHLGKKVRVRNNSIQTLKKRYIKNKVS